jgi:hypothetical protein
MPGYKDCGNSVYCGIDWPFLTLCHRCPQPSTARDMKLKGVIMCCTSCVCVDLHFASRITKLCFFNTHLCMSSKCASHSNYKVLFLYVLYELHNDD